MINHQEHDVIKIVATRKTCKTFKQKSNLFRFISLILMCEFKNCEDVKNTCKTHDRKRSRS